MTAIRFFVPERPFVKQRPRFGRGQTYTPKETREAEEAIRHFAKRAMPDGFEPMTGPLQITMRFVFARPKRPAKASLVTRWHFQKPAGDNLGKLVDALNPKKAIPDWTPMWFDDGQLARWIIEKTWADDLHIEGTTVVVEAL